MDTPEQKEIRITVRLPQELHERLVKLTEHERRSLNSEILSLLEQSLNYREDDIRRAMARDFKRGSFKRKKG